MDKKEQTRVRVQRYRDKQKALQDVTQTAVTQPEDVTQNVTHKLVFNDDSSVLDLDLLMARKDKLQMLIDYMSSMDKTRKLMGHIRYGVDGPTLDRVSVALSCLS